MTVERQQRIMRILAEALDGPPDEQDAFLARACGDDEEMRREIDALLARQDASARFEQFLLEGAVRRLAADEAALIGARLGPYRVASEIGRGGMGAVYLATRVDDEYQRQVAIKLIKRGMDSDAIQRRFRRERQILANLDHPHIARLFDGGTTPDGRPYLVMEYIAGLPIDRYASERRLDETSTIALFLKVCEAVDYAHRHHVVHGDIKPANILVTDEGVAKLLDFGIARMINAAPSDGTTGTWPVMTPEYASPEQVRGEPIAAASDVYALGAVLKELLVGRAATVPPPPLRAKRDIDTILTMALRDEPERRYATVAALADDLSRYLGRRPIKARKDTLFYRGRSFATRHKVTVLTTAAAALCCVFLGMFFAWLAIRPNPSHSIAVLPFETTDADEGSKTLSEGVTDSLIQSFGREASLTVPARDSVFHLRGRPPNDAARALHVGVVLRGQLNATPERLTIHATLFDARRGHEIWNQSYGGMPSEIFSIEDQIVADVSRQIGVPLVIAGPSAPRRHTESDLAYREYLTGRSIWNLREMRRMPKAIEHFQLAIAADSHYALPYGGIADAYGLIGAFGGDAHDVFPKARAAALKAIALDDSLAEGHTSLALVTWLYDWDWARADQEFRRAIALDPQFVRAHHWYGLFLGEMGRFDEAIAQMQQAVALDPMSPPVYADRGRVYFWARQYDKARESYRQAFDLGATDTFLIEAMELYEQSDPAEYLNGLIALNAPGVDIAVYRKSGSAEMWREAIARWNRDDPARIRRLDVWLALAYARAGDTDRAFSVLNAAFQTRDHRLTQLKVNPIFDSIRSDPRFRALLQRMNLGR